MNLYRLNCHFGGLDIFHRTSYLRKLRPFYDSDLIKVVTGIRRCGKSCLLKTVIEELREAGIEESHVAYLDLDARGNRKITTPDQLDALIEQSINLDLPGTKYLFIDEVQNVNDFEKVINGYREEGDISIFITGSNSYLLSGELATKLTGRYIEIEMFTLSFAEYLEMKKFLGRTLSPTAQEFDEYLTYGGFPQTLEFTDAQAKADYIESVVAQIFDKDIREHSKVRNKEAFDRVLTYVINNFGAPTNFGNMEEHFRNVENIAIRRETIARYVDLLINAKILYKCERFDLKSRKSLRGDEKYYLADPGIYFARNTDARINSISAGKRAVRLLKNARLRISVGRIGKLECDFIVRKLAERLSRCIQVSMTIADRNVEEREYRPFSKIKDAYPRYLFTLDPLLQKRDGVKHLNLLQFLEEQGEIL